MSKAMIVTVGTGRNRKDIAHCVCFSIFQQNPEFILYIATQKSNTETIPIILENEQVKNIKYGTKIISDENDLEQIQLECKGFIKTIAYPLENIIVDYTSGTKAMSAGIIYAALELGVSAVTYIVGKRDEEGRVISGTERALSFRPNIINAEKLFKQAIRLFNSCQFDSCLTMLSQAKELTSELEFQDKISLLDGLANAYSSWDKFNLADASRFLKDLSNNELLAQWGIRNQVERNKQLLYKENKEQFCLERVVDLLENAYRRGIVENKYDDGVARLYRTLEYIAQIKINEKKMYRRDKSIEIDLDKLPPHLKEKYNDKLPLFKSYELLSDLNDPFGKKFMQTINEKDSKIKALLASRNNSILAHGFNNIDKNTYTTMMEFIENLVSDEYKDIQHFRKMVKFPDIKL